MSSYGWVLLGFFSSAKEALRKAEALGWRLGGLEQKEPGRPAGWGGQNSSRDPEAAAPGPQALLLAPQARD